MSADQIAAVVETPATAAPADPGPQEFKVIGQDPIEPEAKAAETPAPAPAKAAGSEEQNGDKNRDDKGRFKGVQDRIDELTRSRREAEREAEYWKTRAQANDKQVPAKAAAAPIEKPVRTDFESDDAFLEALADHKVEAKLAEREARQQQEQQQRSRVEAASKVASSWEERKAAARAEIPDYDSVMEGADHPVRNHVAELIMEHDHGPKLMHHLAQHPEEIDKLNEMTPAKAAFELGKLAIKFEKAAPAADSSSKPVARETKAPPPAARNVGSGSATETALGDLPMEDYIARRRSQGASWAR